MNIVILDWSKSEDLNSVTFFFLFFFFPGLGVEGGVRQGRGAVRHFASSVFIVLFIFRSTVPIFVPCLCFALLFAPPFAVCHAQIFLLSLVFQPFLFLFTYFQLRSFCSHLFQHAFIYPRAYLLSLSFCVSYRR